MRGLGPADPRQVGEYRLVGLLGSGGMGVVYLGQGQGDELVAVKVVHEALSRQPEFRVRFAREVRALQRVQGPFTAGLVGFDVEAAQPWVAMQYVPGPTLDEAVQATGPLPADQVRAFAVGLAAAIDSLHRAGLIHRDLKPGNVILSPTGPIIVDLGIAHAVGATALTVTGQRIGTFGWMAPEQLHGRAETPATDMFAWACLVCLAATGEHPFGAGRAEAVAVRIMTGEPDLSRIDDLDVPLRDCVTLALSKEPAARPSAAEVLRAVTHTAGDGDTLLDQAASTVLASWVPTQVITDPAATVIITPVGDPAGDPHSGGAGSGEFQRSALASPGRRNRRRLAVGALAIMAVLGASAVAVQTLGQEEGKVADAAEPSASATGTQTPSPEPESPTPSADPTLDIGSPTRTPSASLSAAEVVVGETVNGMTLDDAIAAAQVDSCDTCVDLTSTRAAAEESARRGLVELGVSDPDGGGYIGLWAYSDEGWQALTGYQDSVPMPNRLPDQIWICTDSSSTNVRSGPGTEYPVVAAVETDTLVDATYMQLTEPQTSDADGLWVDGEGWFEVASDDFRGWVTSSRVDTNDACSLWRVVEGLDG